MVQMLNFLPVSYDFKCAFCPVFSVNVSYGRQFQEIAILAYIFTSLKSWYYSLQSWNGLSVLRRVYYWRFCVLANFSPARLCKIFSIPVECFIVRRLFLYMISSHGITCYIEFLRLDDQIAKEDWHFAYVDSFFLSLFFISLFCSPKIPKILINICSSICLI